MATTNIDDLNLDSEATDETITPANSSRTVSTYVDETTPDVQGEITSSDLRLPRLNLAQKSGDLGDSFDRGSIVIAKEFAIAKVEEVISGVTVAKIRKQYQEKLPYEKGRPPGRTFDTVKQLREAGMSLNKGDDGYCTPVAHMLLILPAIDGLDEDELDGFFFHSYQGKRYGRILYTAADSQYTEAGKTVLTASDKPDCSPPYSIRRAKWDIKTIEKNGNMGKWWVLKFTRTGNNDPTFIEFTQSIQS